MQLTGFTDLALRLLMRLVVLEPGVSTTTEALSQELDVRYSHAVKAMAALQRLGVVESRRGRNGGVRLADGAGSVSIGFLAGELEGPREVVTCEGASPCPLRGGCGLRSALRVAREAFFASLDSVTVADVAAPPTRQLLLTIAARPA
ncbi:Rrf2 family transcriptional regulator [Luethyella okanaganae]|uniref:Rrf2 family transcriptional regulator n=1 Tax=Luethyella okanaganae TaxID=69372 RepID=A0ABW1VE31_9MICO